jgi:dephospho-CoA kinase
MTEKEQAMRNELFIEIAGGQGAGKTQALNILKDLFTNLGADVVWTDGGGRKREAAPAETGPFKGTRINIDTVLVV